MWLAKKSPSSVCDGPSRRLQVLRCNLMFFPHQPHGRQEWDLVCITSRWIRRLTYKYRGWLIQVCDYLAILFNFPTTSLSRDTP